MPEIVEIAVSDVAYGGRGLARLEGCVVFIPGVLPGEKVRAQIIRKRKNYWEAELAEVLEPSASRIEPVCPLVETCPGCCYQHVNYREEVCLKQAQLANLLERQAGLPAINYLPPQPSPAALGYRNKIVLHAEPGQNGVLLGYLGHDNKSVLDVPRCLLATESINELLKQLRGDQKLLRSLPGGANLTLRHTERDGAVYFTSGARPGIAGEGGAVRRSLTENSGIGPLSVPLKSFYQVNPGVADRILRQITDIISQTKPSAVIDLYCGVGVFALTARKSGVERVIGIDGDAQAVKAACENAVDLGLAPASFLRATANRGLKAALADIDPATAALIVDPPRSGLDKGVIDLICRNRPAHLIYVSCAADTLARDLASLSKGGYRVSGVQLFDMFPRTPYFESVAHLAG